MPKNYLFEKPWKKDSGGRVPNIYCTQAYAQLWLIFQDRNLAKCKEMLRQHRNLDINTLYSHSTFVWGCFWEALGGGAGEWFTGFGFFVAVWLCLQVAGQENCKAGRQCLSFLTSVFPLSVCYPCKFGNSFKYHQREEQVKALVSPTKMLKTMHLLQFKTY